MAEKEGAAARLEALCDRVETLLAEREATISALRVERDAALAERDRLKARADAAETARQEDFLLRSEAADALDRAINELRSMAAAQDAERH